MSSPSISTVDTLHTHARHVDVTMQTQQDDQCKCMFASVLCRVAVVAHTVMPSNRVFNHADARCRKTTPETLPLLGMLTSPRSLLFLQHDSHHSAQDTKLTPSLQYPNTHVPGLVVAHDNE